VKRTQQVKILSHAAQYDSPWGEGVALGYAENFPGVNQSRPSGLLVLQP
jgi:hypothetical protein